MATAAEGGGRPITLANVGKPVARGGDRARDRRPRSPGRSRLARRLAVIAQFCLVLADRAGIVKLKSFDAAAYASEVAANSDFRKFDDGLRMTLDCSPEFADALETRLDMAADIAHYGTFRQNSALLTCFVPVGQRPQPRPFRRRRGRRLRHGGAGAEGTARGRGREMRLLCANALGLSSDRKEW